MSNTVRVRPRHQPLPWPFNGVGRHRPTRGGGRNERWARMYQLPIEKGARRLNMRGEGTQRHIAQTEYHCSSPAGPCALKQPYQHMSILCKRTVRCVLSGATTGLQKPLGTLSPRPLQCRVMRAARVFQASHTCIELQPQLHGHQ